MNYLFFDIECSDGTHMCSFGYVLVNKEFNIIKKEDIVLNPEWRFQLARYGARPNVQLSYTEDYFKRQPPFPAFYQAIKSLLTAPNTVVLGHSIASDINYLLIACNRYNLPTIYFDAFDTQKLYAAQDGQEHNKALESIVKELDLDIGDLTLHRSCDDAELALRVVKAIAAKNNTTVAHIVKSNPQSIAKTEVLDQAFKQKQFALALKKLLAPLPNDQVKPTVCLSDTLLKNNLTQKFELVKNILACGYGYANSLSQCNYYVPGQEPSKQDASFAYHSAQNAKIKKISLQKLQAMLQNAGNQNLQNQSGSNAS